MWTQIMILCLKFILMPVSKFTVWNFQKFFATQIFREISFKNNVSKTTISTHLEALDLIFHEFVLYLKAEMYPSQKFRASDIAKMAFLTFIFSKIDFT